MKRPEWCNLREFRCYAPTAVLMLGLLVLTGWGLWLMQGKEVRAIQPRHMVMGFLGWIVAGPVIVGLFRGWRRQRRHLGRGR
ncbi:MAG: hypothetical protein HYU66_01325 [Armatimonadetes bacterium]|nr:hypothetical protein [Armatimonadota bacterium]